MIRRFFLAVVCGLFATIPMTFVGWLGPALGLGRFSVPELLAGYTGVAEPIGWLAHFTVGGSLALGYAACALGYATLARRGSGGGARMGVGYGIVLWLASQLVVLPLVSSTALPAQAAGASLLAHLAYGLTLGLLYRELTREAPAPAPVLALASASRRTRSR